MPSLLPQHYVILNFAASRVLCCSDCGLPKCRKHSVANIVRDTVFAGAVETQKRPTLPPHSFCHIGHEISVPLINTRERTAMTDWRRERQDLNEYLLEQDWDVFGTLKFVDGRSIGRTTANKLLRSYWNRLDRVFFGHAADRQKDRKSTRLNSSHITRSRMPSSA